MIETIQWTSDGVVMIDQTRLPHEETYVTCTDYKQVAEAIRSMVIRGAPAIGVAAAMGALCAHATEGRDAKDRTRLNRANAADTARKRRGFIETPKDGSGNASKYTYTFRSWLEDFDPFAG